jgi:hypothetical protein
MKIAIVPADDTQPIEIKDIETNLAVYQKIVDGNIEAVRLVDNEKGAVAMDMYVNEEFLLRDDLEANGRASILYLFSFNTATVLYGNAVLIGGVDAHGNDKGLSKKQVDFLKLSFIAVVDTTAQD